MLVLLMTANMSILDKPRISLARVQSAPNPIFFFYLFSKRIRNLVKIKKKKKKERKELSKSVKSVQVCEAVMF